MKDAILWKRVLRHGISSPGSSFVRDTESVVIRSPIIVDARGHDVAERSDNGKKIILSEMSGIVLPFPKFWVEGWFLNGYRLGAIVKHEPLDLGIRVAMLVFHDHPDCETVLTMGGFYCSIDNDGCNARDLECHVSPQKIESAKLYHTCILASAFLVLDTLQMLGCKNVDLSPRRQIDARAVKEATRRNGGHPAGYRYHVLTVRPAGSKPGTPGQEIGNMPRHVCRGHFAEYGPQYGKGLLFGKHEGRFFIPPHLKGDAKNGIVEKDYRVTE